MHASSNQSKAGNTHSKSGSSEASIVPPVISREFHDLLTDIEDLVREATSLTGEDLHQAREKFTARLNDARVAAQTMGDDLLQQARQTAGEANEYVHEKPWMVIGAGVAAAFVVGLLLARRRHSAA